MKAARRRITENISKKARVLGTTGVLFGDVIYQAGGRHGPRVLPYYQLVLVRTGEARVDVAGATITVPERHAALFLPGRREVFQFAPNRPTHHAWCSVAPSLMSTSLQSACERAPTVQVLDRRLETLVELGLSVPRHAGPAADPLVEALGVAALESYVFSGRMGSAGKPPPPDALWRALEWSAQLGDQPADGAAMARVAGVSSSQLAKIFRQHLGTTPMRHVWRVRTERGAQLLRETGLSISEVAYRCGFQTPFHFSRWMRKQFGMSPKEWRSRPHG
jgi:AraC family transcriptional regulator of arabinose operon